MIDTKLVLLEGPPGSGKSTISKKIFDWLSVDNKHLVQEHSEYHPIAERNLYYDMDVWQEKTLHNWEKLSAEIHTKDTLYIMEFALFQNTIGSMLLANCSRTDIIKVCLKIVNTIMDISPVMILYTATNAKTFVRETYELRDSSWKDNVDHLIDHLPYGEHKKLKGFDGFLAFYDEYTSIADFVYDRLEMDKIRIDVTKREWPKIEKLTQEFLKI